MLIIMCDFRIPPESRCELGNYAVSSGNYILTFGTTIRFHLQRSRIRCVV